MLQTGGICHLDAHLNSIPENCKNDGHCECCGENSPDHTLEQTAEQRVLHDINTSGQKADAYTAGVTLQMVTNTLVSLLLRPAVYPHCTRQLSGSCQNPDAHRLLLGRLQHSRSRRSSVHVLN